MSEPLDLPAIIQDHAPNTPRTHDSNGAKITPPEVVQCRRCLQAFPCLTRQLAEALTIARRQ